MFTKGPWKCSIVDGRNPIIYTPHGRNCKTPTDAMGGKIAEVYGWGNADANHVENANLMAAAPDMFEALGAVLLHFANKPAPTELLIKVMDATSKAKGEG